MKHHRAANLGLCRGFAVFIWGALFFWLLGCRSIGPDGIREFRLDYGAAIVETRNSQMLANLVRLRYGEPPHFLQVANVSVTESAARGGSVEVSAAPVPAGGAIGGHVSITQTPTISYHPLQGREFAARLLEPLSIPILMSELQMGWRIDRLMLCCVQRVNGLWNMPSASGPTPMAAPRGSGSDFRAMALLLEQLRLNEALQIRFHSVAHRSDDVDHGLTAGEQPPPSPLSINSRSRVECHVSIALIERPRSASAEEAQQNRRAIGRVKDLLGLAQQRNDFCVVSVPSQDGVPDDEIEIASRSLLGTMYYLSQAVDVPYDDVERGVVRRTQGRSDTCGGRPSSSEGCGFDWYAANNHTFRVYENVAEPEDYHVFAKVRYRGLWFYIKDNDIETKSTFSLLDQLFQFQAAVASGSGPALTLPLR